jgi:hypothetical protein
MSILKVSFKNIEQKLDDKLTSLTGKQISYSETIIIIFLVILLTTLLFT